VTSVRSAVLPQSKHLAERGLALGLASRCYTLRRTPEVFPSLRHTNPPLTRSGRIGATAAVTAVGAGTPGELIIGCIAIKLIGAGRTFDLIRAIT
jgi:hypothetical protein